MVFGRADVGCYNGIRLFATKPGENVQKSQYKLVFSIIIFGILRKIKPQDVARGLPFTTWIRDAGRNLSEKNLN